jgi:indoleacetamide hydrolase
MVIAVKDNIQVAGFRTTAGANQLAKLPIPADRAGDAPVVAAVREAGGVLIGTTNMDTWARGVRGLSEVRGQTRNPLDRTRNAGGSSAGSAAAVAANMADAALGTDTCGSIRYPASSVGIYGLKPTWGVVSLEGVVPLAPGQDVVGALARDPATLRRVWAVMTGRASAAGTQTDFEVGSLGTVPAVDERWLAMAKERGLTVRSAGMPPSTAGVNLIEVQFPIAQRAYLSWRSGAGGVSWLTNSGVIGTGSAAEQQVQIHQRRRQLRAALVKRMDDLRVDALIQPVNTALPALLGTRQPSGNCMLASGSGLPALAIPGVPGPGKALSIGVELIGRPGSDDLLLDIADQLAAPRA